MRKKSPRIVEYERFQKLVSKPKVGKLPVPSKPIWWVGYRYTNLSHPYFYEAKTWFEARERARIVQGDGVQVMAYSQIMADS